MQPPGEDLEELADAQQQEVAELVALVNFVDDQRGDIVEKLLGLAGHQHADDDAVGEEDEVRRRRKLRLQVDLVTDGSSDRFTAFVADSIGQGSGADAFGFGDDVGARLLLGGVVFQH